MVTPRRDGPLSRRPIWVVVMDGRGLRALIPRRKRRLVPTGACRGPGDDRRGWPGARSRCRGRQRRQTNRKVSDAYRAKYDERWPGPTETMVNDEVSRTTLRLTQS